MKEKNNVINWVLTIILCFAALFVNIAICHAEEQDIRETMIYNYEKFVNNKELDNYIELFDSKTQNWMNEYRNEPDFFLGEKIEIKQIKSLSSEAGRYAAFIKENEFGSKEVSVYYVQAVCDTKDVTSENIKPLNGDISYVFVFVKENNIWKIGRVSIADVSQIVKSGEGFNNQEEGIALVRENYAMERAALSEPSTICIKMTKAANRNYWNKTYKNIPFKEYILNVVPNEFVVSYGGEYLKAGTMVAKMYGWYFTIHKKYPNSPGGCDLQDTSSDQNYLATSYNDLGVYKSKMDSAYSAVSTKALVNRAGSIFPTEYTSGTTDSSAGKMGASTALSLAQSGKTYLQILKNAYDNSSNAGGQTVKVVSY